MPPFIFFMLMIFTPAAFAMTRQITLRYWLLRAMMLIRASRASARDARVTREEKIDIDEDIIAQHERSRGVKR